MKNIYQMSVPPIYDRLKVNWKDTLTQEQINNMEDINYGGTKHSIYKHLDVSEVLIEDYLEWEGISWDFLILFFKNGYTGRIHTDPNNWCINWICSGHGVFEFWTPEQCVAKREILDDENLPITLFLADKDPYEKFVLGPGAYLFNSSMPHRTGGFNQRLMFSLRSNKDNMSWQDAVNHFSKYVN